MNRTAQILSIFIATSIGYVWVIVPSLQQYTLQLTAVLLLVYFFVKRRGGAAPHHILPTALTIETALLTTTLFLLVGGTGSLNSMFLPALYVLMFLGVFSLDISTLVSLGLLTTLFLWTTTPPPLPTNQLANLISFPIVLAMLVFAKLHEQERRKQQDALAELGESLVLFVSTFLRPKLSHLSSLAEFADQNGQLIKKQLQLVRDELEAFVEKIRSLIQT